VSSVGSEKENNYSLEKWVSMNLIFKMVSKKISFFFNEQRLT